LRSSEVLVGAKQHSSESIHQTPRDSPIEDFEASRFFLGKRGREARVERLAVFVKDGEDAASRGTDAGGVGHSLVVAVRKVVAIDLPEDLVVTDERVGSVARFFVQSQCE